MQHKLMTSNVLHNHLSSWTVNACEESCITRLLWPQATNLSITPRAFRSARTVLCVSLWTVDQTWRRQYHHKLHLMAVSGAFSPTTWSPSADGVLHCFHVMFKSHFIQRLQYFYFVYFVGLESWGSFLTFKTEVKGITSTQSPFSSCSRAFWSYQYWTFNLDKNWKKIWKFEHLEFIENWEISMCWWRWCDMMETSWKVAKWTLWFPPTSI